MAIVQERTEEYEDNKRKNSMRTEEYIGRKTKYECIQSAYNFKTKIKLRTLQKTDMYNPSQFVVMSTIFHCMMQCLQCNLQ